MSDDNFLPPMCCIYFIVCLNFLPIILMTSSVLIYFSLGIHFLVKDISIRGECPDSFVWEYVVFCVIFTPFFYLHHFLKYYLSYRKKTTYRILIFSIGFCIISLVFGGLSFQTNCENDTSDLINFAIASLIFQIIFLIYGFMAYLDYIETIEEKTSLNIQEQPNFGSSSDEIMEGQSSPENDVFVDEDGYNTII